MTLISVKTWLIEARMLGSRVGQVKVTMNFGVASLNPQSILIGIIGVPGISAGVILTMAASKYIVQNRAPGDPQHLSPQS